MELSCAMGGSAAAPPGPGPPPATAATGGPGLREGEEYESLPSGATLSTHMVAGAVAGIMEHTVMYPVDSVKGCSCLAGIAGSVATLLHDAVMNPAEVVKQRLQMFNSPYTSVLGCVQTVHRTEGFGAFYRSYTTQLTMNVPFQAIHFITYELLQEHLNPQRHYNPGSHIVAGAVAGAVAAAATTPLDVCKTLLNTQENMALSSLNIRGHLTGMANAFSTVYQLGGVPGFFKGVQARVIYQMPSTAIAWSVYEFFKYLLTEHTLEKKPSS
ncbi:mitoferrin-1 isoform 2-T2 [Sylvia borin]